jgi:hypothetical protein
MVFTLLSVAQHRKMLFPPPPNPFARNTKPENIRKNTDRKNIFNAFPQQSLKLPRHILRWSVHFMKFSCKILASECNRQRIQSTRHVSVGEPFAQDLIDNEGGGKWPYMHNEHMYTAHTSRLKHKTYKYLSVKGERISSD